MKFENVSYQSSSSANIAAEEKTKSAQRKDDFWSEKNKEDFKKSMSDDSDKSRDGSKTSEKSEKKDNDLSSMFSDFAKQAAMLSGSGKGAVGANGVDSSTRAELQDLVNKMVDKILVSQPRLDGASQVMLTMSDAILPNTTITLTRDISGMLFVNIVSSDPIAFKKLMSTKDMLETELDSHEKNAFRVEVAFDGIDTESVSADMQQPPKNADDILSEGDNENV